jgi:predicted dehydrogenase
MKRFNIGIIGAGRFAQFSLQMFAQVPGVSLYGLAATYPQGVERMRQRFGDLPVMEPEELVAKEEVDMVYIAAPPFLHYPMAMLALRAHKHVLCEKPLALSLQEADELLNEAKKRNLLIITNLMQRYNPLYTAIAQLIQEKPLGELLRASFENYAADEGLPPDHWFWNPNYSGGIFVEHGVHFFDLFEGWLGPGEVLCAQRILRQEGIEEQVRCTVRYRNVLVDFYHGFHQASRMDRQEMTLLFECGDVRLYEWVPCRGRLYALVDESATKHLCEIFPKHQLSILELYDDASRTYTSRFKKREACQKIELRFGDEVPKMQRYGELLKNLLTDQLQYLQDPSHPRRITEENGRSSLRYAIQARDLASKGEP